MKYNTFILFALLVFSASCQSESKPVLPVMVTYKTQGMIPYAHDDRSDSLGNPAYYIPFYIPVEAILEDRDAFYFTDRQQNIHIELEPYAKKEQLAQQYHIDPKKIIDTTVVTPDTSWAQWLSYHFYNLKEPVLSNYYLSDTIYRVTLVSEWSGSISIRVVKGSRPVIVTRKLKHALFLPGWGKKSDMFQRGKVVPKEPYPIVFSADTMRALEPGVLREIDSLFAQVDFARMPYNSKCNDGPYTLYDGAYIVYEMQTKEGYYFFVKCPTPRKDIYSKIFHTLVEYSDLDNLTQNTYLSD